MSKRFLGASVLAVSLAFTGASAHAAAAPPGPNHPTGRGARARGASPQGKLRYHGGDVMRTNTTYAVFWEPPGTTVEDGYNDLITQFLGDVAADSGSTTNVFSVATQYSDSSGSIASNSTFAGSIVDTDPFPTSGCKYPKSVKISTCLTEAQLGTELAGVLNSQGWPRGTDNLYLLFLPKNVGGCHNALDRPMETCGGGDWAFLGACGWHDEMPYNDPPSTTPFAVLPYALSDAKGLPKKACTRGESPNGNDADATINAVSHEMMEAITDPLLTAWYGPKPGVGEIGDLCAAKPVTPLGGAPGRQYDQVINGDDYWLQSEWSNATNSCALGLAVGGSGKLVFDGSPGTDSPPPTLGPYAVQPFDWDTAEDSEYVDSVTGPTGPITFSSWLEHLYAQSDWLTWSNDYDGDVYAALDGQTTVTIKLPPKTHAFYFYAEPNTFDSFIMSATAADGTTSGPITVEGYAGAQYFGFYSPKKTSYLTTLIIACADPDAAGFAIGEFGIG